MKYTPVEVNVARGDQAPHARRGGRQAHADWVAGRAVVIAPALVSVEVFRAQHTYEMLVARHEPQGGEDVRRPRLLSQVLFRGTQGYLSLELWGKDREAAGRIMPEFFNRSGERKEIPLRFVEAVKAAVQGATTIDCREAVLAKAAVTE